MKAEQMDEAGLPSWKILAGISSALDLLPLLARLLQLGLRTFQVFSVYTLARSSGFWGTFFFLLETPKGARTEEARQQSELRETEGQNEARTQEEARLQEDGLNEDKKKRAFKKTALTRTACEKDV